MHYGLVAPHNRLRRKPVNPFDRATIISVYPKDVIESKPTLFPGRFVIPAGSTNNPSVTVLEPTSWFRRMQEGQPAIEVQVNAFEVAKSIVNDYCVGFPKAVMGVMQPGLFFVPGKYDSESIKKYVDEDGSTYANLLARAITRQNAWYEELVKMADIDWARTQGNPLSISEMSKLAAKELGRNSKPWLQDFLAVSLTPCAACGVMGNPAYPKCSSCGFIKDQALAISVGLLPATGEADFLSGAKK